MKSHLFSSQYLFHLVSNGFIYSLYDLQVLIFSVQLFHILCKSTWPYVHVPLLFVISPARHTLCFVINPGFASNTLRLLFSFLSNQNICACLSINYHFRWCIARVYQRSIVLHPTMEYTRRNFNNTLLCFCIVIIRFLITLNNLRCLASNFQFLLDPSSMCVVFI